MKISFAEMYHCLGVVLMDCLLKMDLKTNKWVDPFKG